MVAVHIDGTGPEHVWGRLERVNPRATVELPHPAFSSAAGGPLDVKTVAAPDHATASGEQMELTRPGFLAVVRLPDQFSQTLLAGQTGSLKIRMSRGSVGEVLYDRLSRWLHERTESSG